MLAHSLEAAAADRRWGVVSGQAGRHGPATGSGGQLFGRWWLAAQGVEFDDKLQALDFVSNGWKI